MVLMMILYLLSSGLEGNNLAITDDINADTEVSKVKDSLMPRLQILITLILCQ